MIEGHGDDTHHYEGKIAHNFSSNVYYKGCPPELMNYLASELQTIQNYPSPSAHELNEVAATRLNVPSDQFLFTNGATEAFYLIAKVFSGQKAAIVAPTFSEYEDACKIHGVHYQLINKSSLKSCEYDLVFICNPNNPDGNIIPTDELVTIITGFPTTIFVIDEAYIEFTNQLPSLAPQVKSLPNLIVVKSLTKTFAIPGLRLGYVMASDNVIKKLLDKKMPWTVNALAIKAGLQLFRNYDQWQFNVQELIHATQRFINALSVINWLEVRPTHTSYFLVKVGKNSAAELKKYLAEEHGILVRDATNFNGLEGEYIRLATQSTASNQVLINALKAWN